MISREHALLHGNKGDEIIEAGIATISMSLVEEYIKLVDNCKVARIELENNDDKLKEAKRLIANKNPTDINKAIFGEGEGEGKFEGLLKIIENQNLVGAFETKLKNPEQTVVSQTEAAMRRSPAGEKGGGSNTGQPTMGEPEKINALEMMFQFIIGTTVLSYRDIYEILYRLITNSGLNPRKSLILFMVNPVV